jgi:RNA recognition motif-containing protein
MSTQYPSRGPRRRRPRSRRGNNPHSRSLEPKKKKNPILAFFEKLFGKKSAAPARGNGFERRENGARSPRREGRRLNIEEAAASGESETPRDTRPAPDDANQPEATSPRLYIGNLSYDASESDLFDLFAQVGAVKNVEIVRDRRGSSKGFGFVEMDSIEIANQAITKLNRTDYMGRPMVVGGAKK